MDKITIGIPKALTYYYYDIFWKNFFKILDVNVIYSPDTNIDILNKGSSIANDEMCLSLKIYLGHVDYLKDKCDYILIPRIENYGKNNQTCTNFLGLYDLVNNLFNINILDYNISNNNELEQLIILGNKIGISKDKIVFAFNKANELLNSEYSNNQLIQLKKLDDDTIKKILLISHPYNTYDNLIGKSIIDMFKKYNVEIIYSDLFNHDITSKKALDISPSLYWKYSKECIGSIEYSNKVNGIVFLSSFPCGLDSLVNEYAMRKIHMPYLNLIIDDISSLTGIETRIESFVDIINEN